MSKQNKKQIVTVAVITYHSTATVLETLDSIVNQIYGPENIELIISDDGSKDNTVEVINDWLTLHHTKFHSVKLFANEVNCGIPKNCNIAWKAATSEWIKTIAGDDILLPNCLVDNIEFVFANLDCRILFSLMQDFNTDSGQLVKGQLQPFIYSLPFFKKSAIEQFRILLVDSFNFAPTSFIKRELLCEVGFADERYKLIEDLPLWLKITDAGNKLYFLNSVTVLYRHAESVSRIKARLVNVDFFNVLLLLHKELIKPRLTTFLQYIMYYDKIVYFKWVLFVAKMTGNVNTRCSRNLRRLISFFRPIIYINLYRKYKYK